MSTGKLVVGVTGASGAIYAQRFLIQAAQKFEKIYLILSEQATQVSLQELGVAPKVNPFYSQEWLGAEYPNI